MLLSLVLLAVVSCLPAHLSTVEKKNHMLRKRKPQEKTFKGFIEHFETNWLKAIVWPMYVCSSFSKQHFF